MTSRGSVTLDRRDKVGWITLDRPDKLNALAGDMREQLRDAIAQAADDPAVSSLIITGRGRGFCAGGDIETMNELQQSRDAERFHAILHAGAECVLALQAFPGLTVAAVNGIAAGAGFGLALGCDLRVASPHARFAASWSGVGLAPDWGATFWLPRMLGYARATELVFSGRVLDATQAHEMGLVLEVVDPDELQDRAQEIAVRHGAAEEMVRHTKGLLRKGLTGSIEAALAAETEVQEDLFDGDDVAEGLTAFREKRPPRFGDR